MYLSKRHDDHDPYALCWVCIDISVGPFLPPDEMYKYYIVYYETVTLEALFTRMVVALLMRGRCIVIT